MQKRSDVIWRELQRLVLDQGRVDRKKCHEIINEARLPDDENVHLHNLVEAW